MIKLEKYTKNYLVNSSIWLNDPEIKFLTNTPDFSEEDQKKWFEGLEQKIDYKIWGVSFDSIPIGVFGIKNINLNDKSGEYWGYIGEEQYRNKGLGKTIMNNLLEIAQTELKLEKIFLKVLLENVVAISFYRKFDFLEISRENGIITMLKIF